MSYEYSNGRLVRKIALAGGLLALAGLALVGWMYRLASSDPIVRRAIVYTAGPATPVRMLLVSDVHVAGPDMTPQRLERIVSQLNSYHPDIVLLAGDFISDKRTSTRTYSIAQAVAPLAELQTAFGTFAVLGNHDHWRDAVGFRRELRKVGNSVLDNSAVQAGTVTIGGVDDPFTGHDDLQRTLADFNGRRGPRIMLSHSPDIFPEVPKDVVLTVAGHTHCGQIRLPFVGALSTMSRYGSRYGCGRIDEGGRTLIVSAGLGTSVLPLRLGAAPDVWLIEIRGQRAN